MTTATYIHGEREYVLTGRQASKSSTRPSGKEKNLVEIRPSNVDAADTNFNKWVKMEELFHVIAGENDDE